MGTLSQSQRDLRASTHRLSGFFSPPLATRLVHALAVVATLCERPSRVGARPITVASVSTSPAYALITPARDEAVNLARLGGCVVRQTARPSCWMIIDDGSTDETPEVAAGLARDHSWIHVLESPGRLARAGGLGDGRSRGRDVLAFNAGIDAIEEPLAYVVKLDADVSFAADYFKRLLAEFSADPTLGIASGLCHELERGAWVPRHVTEGHVRGATRIWRWACFEQIRPLEQRLGWDIVDELKAASLGWRAASIPDVGFFHHRPVGQRDGRVRPWIDQGETAYYVGYRAWYLAARAVHRARREPAALALVWGYLAAAAANGPRVDARIRSQLRDKQRLRSLPQRRREATGRRASRVRPNA